MLSQKMDIEKKRERVRELTQTLEDEKSWTGEGGHEVGRGGRGGRDDGGNWNGYV